MTRLEEIKTTDWSMQLDPLGRPGSGLGEIVRDLADVDQCLRIIVTTPPGTDPLRPAFACDIFSFLDRPITTMRPHAVRAITDAIERWEPRVVVIRVRVAIVQPASGIVAIGIVWKLNVQNAALSTPQRTILALPVQ